MNIDKFGSKNISFEKKDDENPVKETEKTPISQTKVEQKELSKEEKKVQSEKMSLKEELLKRDILKEQSKMGNKKEQEFHLPPKPDLLAEKEEYLFLAKSEKMMEQNELKEKAELPIKKFMVTEKLLNIPFNKIRVGKKIGLGAQSKIKMGVWEDKVVALKKSVQPTRNEVPKRLRGNIEELTNKMLQERDNEMKHELVILGSLNHKNIIQGYGLTIDPKKGRLTSVIEYWKNDIKLNGLKNPQDKQKIATQLIEVLLYLHQNGIIHNDLQPANILINNDLELKLIDFGTAGMVQARNAKVENAKARGHEYLDVSYLIEKGYTEKIDIYSLGFLFYEMATGKSPFKEKMPKVNLSDPMAISTNLVINAGEFLTKTECPPTLSKEFFNFIKLMIDRDPNNRPSIEQVQTEFTRLTLEGKTFL